MKLKSAYLVSLLFNKIICSELKTGTSLNITDLLRRYRLQAELPMNNSVAIRALYSVPNTYPSAELLIEPEKIYNIKNIRTFEYIVWQKTIKMLCQLQSSLIDA